MFVKSDAGTSSSTTATPVREQTRTQRRILQLYMGLNRGRDMDEDDLENGIYKQEIQHNASNISDKQYLLRLNDKHHLNITNCMRESLLCKVATCGDITEIPHEKKQLTI